MSCIIVTWCLACVGQTGSPRTSESTDGLSAIGILGDISADLIVLCYHALSPTWTAALSTTPDRFERQIALLTARGYKGATFTQAVVAPPRERTLVITFDDAYHSVIEHARPILAHYKLPATVFVPTDFIDSGRPMRWAGIEHWLGGPHERELRPMSWVELATLIDAGWEVGSHTASHPRLTQLDDATLAEELARSKAACEERLAAPCTCLAYPYGDLDDNVVGAASRAGYGAAAALPERLNADEVMQWPRIGIYHADGDVRFRLKVSPTIRRLRRSRAAGGLALLSLAAQRAMAAIRA
jgi:peptidoglycan/xylan/chitin deacetylase (PgdA/CDA1 family)